MLGIEEPQGVNATGDIAGAPDSIHDVPTGGELVQLLRVVENKASSSRDEFFQDLEEDLHGVTGVFLAAVDLTEYVEDDEGRVDFLDGTVQKAIEGGVSKITDCDLGGGVEGEEGAIESFSRVV